MGQILPPPSHLKCNQADGSCNSRDSLSCGPSLQLHMYIYQFLSLISHHREFLRQTQSQVSVPPWDRRSGPLFWHGFCGKGTLCGWSVGVCSIRMQHTFLSPGVFPCHNHCPSLSLCSGSPHRQSHTQSFPNVTITTTTKVRIVAVFL